MTDLSKRTNDMDATIDTKNAKASWIDLCSLTDLPYDAGVAALIDENTPEETQIALFLPEDSDYVYAISNFDPFSEANVLARGILCSIGDELAVASPVHKEHFSLSTGKCFEDDTVAVTTYPTKIEEGRVFICVTPVAPAGEV